MSSCTALCQGSSLLGRHGSRASGFRGILSLFVRKFCAQQPPFLLFRIQFFHCSFLSAGQLQTYPILLSRCSYGVLRFGCRFVSSFDHGRVLFHRIRGSLRLQGLWNLLPKNIRDVSDTARFKTLLKSFLLIRGDDYMTWVNRR